jgi:hypothetical protein
LALNVLLVNPGASSAICAGARPTGSASTSRFVINVLVVTVAIGVGVSAVTVTTSVRAASAIVVLISAVPPTVTWMSRRSAGWKFWMSNRTV